VILAIKAMQVAAAKKNVADAVFAADHRFFALMQGDRGNLRACPGTAETEVMIPVYPAAMGAEGTFR